jgi:hypothetical protein
LQATPRDLAWSVDRGIGGPLDQWVELWRKKVAKGDVIVVRYADDLVLGFQYRKEAEQFLREFRERLASSVWNYTQTRLNGRRHRQRVGQKGVLSQNGEVQSQVEALYFIPKFQGCSDSHVFGLSMQQL